MRSGTPSGPPRGEVRATRQERESVPPTCARGCPPPRECLGRSARIATLVARYMRAWEAADVETLVALLREGA